MFLITFFQPTVSLGSLDLFSVQTKLYLGSMFSWKAMWKIKKWFSLLNFWHCTFSTIYKLLNRHTRSFYQVSACCFYWLVILLQQQSLELSMTRRTFANYSSSRKLRAFRYFLTGRADALSWPLLPSRGLGLVLHFPFIHTNLSINQITKS